MSQGSKEYNGEVWNTLKQSIMWPVLHCLVFKAHITSISIIINDFEII